MIQISGLSAEYNASPVLRSVSFSVPERAVHAVIGPSGCGKTTLLNLLMGDKRVSISQGDYLISDSQNISYMMQDSILLAWRNAFENARLSMEIRRPGLDCDAAISDWFQRLGLHADAGKYPSALSGGMCQRVALIRALLVAPKVLLLDEPFTGLDFETKLNVQRHLMDYQRLSDATILLVTHDIEDAIALADKVIIMGGHPATVYEEIVIELDLKNKDPVEARKSSIFREYFLRIWQSIQKAQTS